MFSKQWPKLWRTSPRLPPGRRRSGGRHSDQHGQHHFWRGALGLGALSLVNQTGGSIDATSPFTLVLNTGTNAMVNAGLLESSASGGLTIIDSDVLTNTGTPWADGDTLAVTGNVSGTGAGRISGAGTLHLAGSVVSGQTIGFDTGSTGTLRLANARPLSGTIVGLAASSANVLDLSDIGFISGTTKATTFQTATDVNGGTKGIDPSEALVSLLLCRCASDGAIRHVAALADVLVDAGDCPRCGRLAVPRDIGPHCPNAATRGVTEVSPQSVLGVGLRSFVGLRSVAVGRPCWVPVASARRRNRARSILETSVDGVRSRRRTGSKD